MKNSGTESKFEELIAWQKARAFQKEIFIEFNSQKHYWFKDQFFRAILSVTNNISEGFERRSNKEFIYFLHVAKGSCGEVRSMLYFAEDMGYCEFALANKFRNLSLEVSRIIQGLINYLKTKI